MYYIHNLAAPLGSARQVERERRVMPGFDRITAALAHFAGRPAMLAICGCLALAGAAAFASGNAQLTNGANLAISVVTLLLLPVLQASQNRDSLAMHVKLDAITPGNELNRAEELAEREIEELRNG